MTIPEEQNQDTIEKPLYLEIQQQDLSGGSNQVHLVRPLPWSYLGRTIGECLDYAANVHPDETIDASTATQIEYFSEALTRANTQSSSVRFYSRDKNDPGKRINLSLDDRLSSHKDDIIVVRNKQENNPISTFACIPIIYADKSSGGLDYFLR